MSIRQLAIAFPVTAIAFLALDAVWLTLMADRLYRPALGNQLLERFAIAPALVFYVIYTVGVVVFAVAPGLSAERWPVALGYGALLGLVAYGTYNLTNQATLKVWPLHLVLADMAWGTVATAVAAGIACVATAWIDGMLS